jgi:hypothetical protein
MYHDLGIHWASSIPAFLTLACMPFPFLFYKYGKPIRMKSKFAAEAAAVLARLMSAAKGGANPATNISEKQPDSPAGGILSDDDDNTTTFEQSRQGSVVQDIETSKEKDLQ